MNLDDYDERCLANCVDAVRKAHVELDWTQANFLERLTNLLGHDEYSDSDLARWWDIQQILGSTEEIGAEIWNRVLAKEYFAPSKAAGLRKMNTRYGVAKTGSKVRVYDLENLDAPPMSIQDFHNLFKGQYVPDDDSNKRISISHYWLNSPDHRVFDKVVFEPGKQVPYNVLNLDRGLRVEPDPDASCELILYHIRTVICGDDPIPFKHLVGWLADTIQNPMIKPGVAVVLKGKKGVGKDTIADLMALILGREHVPVISKIDDLTGRFAGPKLQRALIANVQEAIWGGSRKDQGVLQAEITSDWVSCEFKGVDAVQVPSYTRYLITSNADRPIPASYDERRYLVIDIKSEKQSPEYYRALRAEMGGDGPAAFLHYLLSVDLSHFDVRDVPNTAGLAQQKVEGLTNVERFWFESVSSGDLPGYRDDPDFDWTEDPARVNCSAMRHAYIQFLKETPYQGDRKGEAAFGRALKEVCSGAQKVRPRTNNGREYVYVIPPLPECKLAFESWIGSEVDWGDVL